MGKNNLIHRMTLAVMLLFVTMAVVIASPATIHRLDSPLMADLTTLFISQGLSLPSTAGPWSTDELSFLLEKLNPAKLSSAERQMYDRIDAILRAELKPVSANLHASLETYTHTNTTAFATQDDWVYSYLDRKPLLSIPVHLDLGSFAGYVDFALVNRNIDDRDSPNSAIEGVSELFGRHSFTTNLPFQTFGDDLHLDANIPYQAAMSAGGKGWYLEAGRQQLSWGPGKSGNFLIGDHVQYHNMARLSAYRNGFKYSLVTSFFPHPDEIGPYTSSHSQGDVLKGLKMLLAHRFEWRMANDRFGLVLNEAIMYQSRDGLDLRVLNPLMLYHNYFIRSIANSLATLEFDWAVAKGWNLYGQVAVDELSFGSAEWNLAVKDRHPDGLAFMLGTSYAQIGAKGILTGHLEGVYTDPYLYLRSIHGDNSQASDADNLNFVVAMRRWIPDKVIYDQEFLGYRYGGDAIVVDAGMEYRVPADWSLSSRLFFMIHGEVGKITRWKLGKLQRTPTGTPTYYVQAGLSATKHLGAFGLYGSIDYLSKIHAKKAEHDFQLVVGASWSWR